MGVSISETVEERISSGQTELPVFDRTAQRIQGMLDDGEFEIDELEALIGRDAVLTAALLRLANSTFYAGLDKVTTVREATLRLGAKQVAGLTTMITQKQNYTVRDRSLEPLMKSLWNHSVGCAVGCQWLAERLKRRDLGAEAFMAGMLHDIGKLVVLRVVDDLKAGNRGFDPPEEAIRELMETTHTAHGHFLMESWNIPDPYPGIVLRHHDPELDESDTLLLVVRLVDRVCNQVGLGLEPADAETEKTEESAEATALELSDGIVAELEVALEDTVQVADAA